MIPIVFLAPIAFSSMRVAAEPTALSQAEACALASQERIAEGRTYVIAGTYRADGHHGSFIELPKCDAALFPIMTGDADAQIAAFHQAFQRQCGGVLMGDHIEGVFTGTFSTRKAQLFGMTAPMRISFFMVSAIDAKSLDSASITCSS